MFLCSDDANNFLQTTRTITQKLFSQIQYLETILRKFQRHGSTPSHHPFCLFGFSMKPSNFWGTMLFTEPFVPWD
jgi:hypothetical protein